MRPWHRSKGRCRFPRAAPAAGPDARQDVYKAFDLLWLDGDDLRPLAWSERKRRLQELIEKLPAAATSVLKYVEPLYEDGATVYASVCRLGLEGIVSKQIDAPYRTGRSDAWQKTRCAEAKLCRCWLQREQQRAPRWPLPRAR